MKVNLLHYSPIYVIANGIRYSHNNHHLSDTPFGDDLYEQYTKIGEKDFDLIKRVGFKYKHMSVLEHAVFTFEIEGISRALLQELARHRLQSLTVKSTRYTLKELKKEKDFITYGEKIGNDIVAHYDLERAKKYVVLTDDDKVNAYIIDALERVKWLIQENKSNDIAKYALPEAFKTSLQMTINFRSFLNMVKLRISKEALWEFRLLMLNLINILPPEYFELVMLDDDIQRNYNILMRKYYDKTT